MLWLVSISLNFIQLLHILKRSQQRQFSYRPHATHGESTPSDSTVLPGLQDVLLLFGRTLEIRIKSSQRTTLRRWARRTHSVPDESIANALFVEMMGGTKGGTNGLPYNFAPDRVKPLWTSLGDSTWDREFSDEIEQQLELTSDSKFSVSSFLPMFALRRKRCQCL